MEHQIKETGDLEKPYITRYCLDLDIKAVATEIRIHSDENGKFHIPDEYKAGSSSSNEAADESPFAKLLKDIKL